MVVEDEGFWDHNGIDARAITRALVENVAAGEVNQGGSTITQQLIKNSLIGDERDLERKIPEAALAIRLENELEKEEILERYLNTVYFGGGAYGIRAASEIYYGVTPDQLDWAQSAMLASLISNPGRYDPTRFPDLAGERRTMALERLLDSGHITPEEFEEARNAPLPDERNVASEWQPTSYFIEEVRRRLLEDPRLGATVQERAEALFSGGLRVYTTYDPITQAQAEAAVREEMAGVADDPRGFTAALASIEPGTGRVRAVIGGPGFDEFEFNIATQKGRPTGSSFKVFVLAAAFEKGIVPSDTINGKGPCTFDNPPNGTYRAVNFGGSGGSTKSVRAQTLSSSNCAFLRLGLIVGLANVADTAAALGLNSDPRLFEDSLPLSMPLGPFDVTPLEMAAAYASFANDGVYVEPIFIDRVEDRHGNVIFENRPRARRAVSVQTARLVTDVLEGNVRGGTGTRARLPGQPAAGKTGTGQSFYDATFAGYTPHLATAVWVGNPEEQIAMVGVPGVGRVTGGSLPARIWGNFNTAYHDGREVLTFADPDSTRRGTRIRTDDEQDDYERIRESPCGSFAAEIDEDDDGTVDACEDGHEVIYDRDVGGCPALMEPIDTNENGINDTCVVASTTTTTPPTTVPPTTVPPTTTAPPTTTTAPPTTTTAPPTTTTAPPTTSTPED